MGGEMSTSAWRRLVAEFVGTGLLVTVVVGSGIMADRLSPDDVGLQLLDNSLATALGLTVLILVFGPVSGAHFNPLVSAVDAVIDRGLRPVEFGGYLVAQIIGGIGGALLANTMFGVAPAIASTDRAEVATLLGEVVASAGLLLVILGLSRTGRIAIIAPAVGAYIGSAYWFTSSTSFANPAVTIGRIFSDTFAGIAPSSALAFIVAQLVGAIVGGALATLLFPRTPLSRSSSTPRARPLLCVQRSAAPSPPP
jgi:glycerol uptake facilitator-like aquaporin